MKKILSLLLSLVLVINVVGLNIVGAEELENVQIKTVFADGISYTITSYSIGEERNVIITNKFSGDEYALILNEEEGTIDEEFTDGDTNKETVILDDYEVEVGDDFQAMSTVYQSKKYCKYLSKYWYAERKDCKYWKIGCDRSYTIRNSGKAGDLVKNYVQTIKNCNSRYNKICYECAAAGISMPVVIIIVSANIALPQSVIIDVVCSAFGIATGSGALVVATAKAVYDSYKIITSDGPKVKSTYTKAKKYAI